MKNFYTTACNKKGASIIIAVGMIAVIMFFTIGIASTMLMTLGNTSNAKKALQAEYAAQSGVEMALYDLAGMDPAFFGTYPSGAQYSIYYFNPAPDIGLHSDFLIYGQDNETPYSGEYSGFRSIPVKGRGNASIDCDTISDDEKNDTDNICNWNKIYYGESIDIPLYVSLPQATGSFLNPNNAYNYSPLDTPPFLFSEGGLGTQELKLNVRTPCENGTGAECSRYQIAPPGPDEDQGDLILGWQISGDCFKDGEEISSPCSASQVLDAPPPLVSAIREWELSNTVVSVNFNSDNTAVDLDSLTGSALNFLKNLAPWNTAHINQPKLKLSFIKEIYADNRPVSYLEYQILYKNNPSSGEPDSNSFASSYLINVNGFSDLFKYSVSGVRDMRSGLFDFAVQN